MTSPNSLPALRTIKAHGAPDRALWYGGGTTPAPTGTLCSIGPTSGGWHVRVDGGDPVYVGSRERVWLGPILDTQGDPWQVLNPEPVHLRLRTATTGTYLALRSILLAAANLAENHALTAPGGSPAEEFRTVRDALRRAATDAVVPFPADKAPACRRCGAGCPECIPAAEQ